MPKANRKQVAQPHQPSRLERAGDVMAKAVAGYFLGKTAVELLKEKKADWADQKATPKARRHPIIAEPVAPEKLDIRGRKDVNLQASYRYTAERFIENINRPGSLMKLISRRDVFHNPWAWHHPPSYAALHVEQSKHIIASGEEPSDYRYLRGIDALVAYGRGVVSEGVRRHLSERTRGVILFDSQKVESDWQAIGVAKDTNQRYVEAERATEVSNVAAAMLGMGFFTDLAFARRETHEGYSSINFQLVPFDRRNPLHVLASFGTDLPSNPGLMLETQSSYSPSHGHEASVAVRVVDIATIRERWTADGAEFPDQIPSPQVLASKEYVQPGVLPSTQSGPYIAVSAA